MMYHFINIINSDLWLNLTIKNEEKWKINIINWLNVIFDTLLGSIWLF